MPSTKVLVHLTVGLVLQLAVFLAKDTTWLGWLPAAAQPIAPIAAQLLAAVAAYVKAETNPAPSSFQN
jgi:hypothetical protein